MTFTQFVKYLYRYLNTRDGVVIILKHNFYYNVVEMLTELECFESASHILMFLNHLCNETSFKRVIDISKLL